MYYTLSFCAYKHKRLGLKLAFQWVLQCLWVYTICSRYIEQLAIREVIATTTMRESRDKNKLTSELHIQLRSKTYWTSVLVFLFFSVCFMDAGFSLGPDLSSKRVTGVSWELDQLRRTRRARTIQFLPQGKNLSVTALRHSTMNCCSLFCGYLC